MREKRNGDSNFEERLLGELKAYVTRRGAEQEAPPEKATHSPRWRHAPRLAGAAAVCLAAAALLVFQSGGDRTPKAFAVESRDGGGVMIKIYSPEDAEGLEAAMEEAGINSQVTWLPTDMTCQEPHFTPTADADGSVDGMRVAGPVRLGGPGAVITFGAMSTQQWRESMRNDPSQTPNINFDPALLRQDETVVIWGSRGPYERNPQGGYEVQVAIAEGPVKPCQPVRAPAGGLLENMTAVLESEADQGRADPAAKARRKGR